MIIPNIWENKKCSNMVDLPSNKMVDLSIVCYVNVYQKVHIQKNIRVRVTNLSPEHS